MNIYLYTFGCKVNSFETAAMAELLAQRGHTIVHAQDRPDAVVINSCTVTANGDKKVRQYLRRVKRDNPDVITVLTGCFPQAFPEQAAQYAEADLSMGTGNRAALPDLLAQFAADREKRADILSNKEKGFELLRAETLEGHTRAFLKIEDGCEQYCAYCIVPYARGPVRSMPIDRLVEQVELFARGGYREIVLSGINLSCYGREAGLTLADAVERTASVAGIERIRLGSLEPDLITDETWRRLAAVDKLCPQFHLALQSGCDTTLKRMNRRYTTAEYTAVADKIRALFDRPTFTTDVMVGFAGETDADFETSLQFVRHFGFLKCHIFPYSIRTGTAGARMPDQVEKSVKESRAAAMAQAADAARAEIMAGFVGARVRVILERQQPDGGFDGYTDRYLPAVVYGTDLREQQLVEGVIAHIEGDRCVVEL